MHKKLQKYIESYDEIQNSGMVVWGNIMFRLHAGLTFKSYVILKNSNN